MGENRNDEETFQAQFSGTKRYRTAKLFWAIANRPENISLSNTFKNGRIEGALSRLAQALRYREYSCAQFIVEPAMARIARICLALVAVCIPTLAWSDPPPPNQTGHAHTCQNYFPKEASETGAQGTTQLAFRIKTDGYVNDIKIESSSGNADLDQAAVRCAQHWHYLPAKKDGEPIEFDWKASVVWVLVERPLDPGKPCIDQYHKEAASPGVHGTTKLTIQVAADGSVTDAAIVDTSGSKELDDLAAVCVKKWRLSAEPQSSTKTAYVSWTIPYDPRK